MMMVQVTMSRFTRLRPVNSLKHIVDKQGGLTVGTQVNDFLINTRDAPVTTANPQEIHIGSTVSSIFLNVQVAASSTAALANVYLIIMKNPGNSLAVPAANAVGISDERKHVIHQEMIMTEKNSTAIPRTLFKGVIKLPPRLRRFGIDDTLIFGLLSPGVTMDYCVQCIYKEFR